METMSQSKWQQTNACTRARVAGRAPACARGPASGRQKTEISCRLKLEIVSRCRKPIISANSCFFKDDEQELNANLLAMMRIWDHDKDAILHHVKVLFAWIRACKTKARQSFDQFLT
jgi:hypothetical protein